MAVVSSFPLLRLPKNATMVTLRIMNHLQLFGISLVSKKSKSLVQSLQIKPQGFTVSIYSDYSLYLAFPRKFIIIRNFKILQNHLKFSVNYGEEQYKWTVIGMDGKKLISHLKTIFNRYTIKFDFGTNYNQQIDFNQILDRSQDIKAIDLSLNFQESHRKILNIIKPSEVHLSCLTARDVLTQHFEYLHARNDKFSLDDLLAVNSRIFVMSCSTIPAKQLNRFLKLWIRGSNPQLECLSLGFRIDDDFSEETLFEKLNPTHNDQVRCFKLLRETIRFIGGTDIFRFDGTMATIRVRYYYGVVCEFKMFVWHEYCIAKKND